MTPAQNLLMNVAEKIPLPAVYHSVRGLLARPDAKINDFVAVINLDPELAIRIIKIAKSDFFGYSRQANTVEQAISLIGIVQLHDLLLSSLAIRAFSGIPSNIVNQKVFWRSCVYCGVTARLLAKKCMLPTSERLFTLGLLHEIGHLVMYIEMPEQMQDIFFELQESYKPLHQLERERIGFDYGQVSSEIMQLWHLPEGYCEISRFQMEPEKAKNNQTEMVLINLARIMAQTEESKLEIVVSHILNRHNAILKGQLTNDDIENIKSKALLHIDDVIDCLWPTDLKTQGEKVTGKL